MMMKIRIWGFHRDTTLELPLDSATTESLRAATHDVLAGLTAREAKFCVCVSVSI